MTSLFEAIASGDLFLRSTNVLLGAGLRGVLLLALVIAGAAALRNRSAATRHALIGAGLLATLVLPLAGLLPWQLEVLPSAVSTATPTVRSAEVPVRIERSAAADISPAGSVTDEVEVESILGERSVNAGAVTSAEPGSLWPALGLIWLAGLFLLSLRMIAGEWRASVILRRARPVEDPEWLDLLWDSSDRLDISDDVALLRSTAVEIPFTTGVFRQAIVLPALADRWDEARRRAVLMHELAHIRRRDIVLHHASRWACLIYWFNPFVWIAARRLRAESERAADDLVLGVGTPASDYADHLLEIVTGIRNVSVPSPVLPLARRREFEGRLLAILEPHLARRAPSRRQTVGLSAAIVLIALPVAALAPAPDPATLADQLAQVTDSADSAVMESRVEWRSDQHAAADPHPMPEPNPDLRIGEGSDAPNPNPIPTAVSVDLDVSTRLTLVHALADSDEDPRVIAALIRLLQTDPAPEVRRAAAMGLAEMEAVEALDALMAAVTSDDDPGVRRMAAMALGEIEADRAVDALAAAMRDGDPEVRKAALFALAELDSPLAANGFITALSDPDPDTRMTAALILGDLDLDRAPPELVAALADGVAEVRTAAAHALGELEDPSTAAALATLLSDSLEEVRMAALFALMELDAPQAIDALISALDHPDPAVRRRVAEALGNQ